MTTEELILLGYIGIDKDGRLFNNSNRCGEIPIYYQPATYTITHHDYISRPNTPPYVVGGRVSRERSKQTQIDVWRRVLEDWNRIDSDYADVITFD